MKKALFLSFLFLATTARAARPGSLGLGVTLGDPFGLTLKYWLTNQQALDVGVGIESDPVLYADYLSITVIDCNYRIACFIAA